MWREALLYCRVLHGGVLTDDHDAGLFQAMVHVNRQMIEVFAREQLALGLDDVSLGACDHLGGSSLAVGEINTQGSGKVDERHAPARLVHCGCDLLAQLVPGDVFTAIGGVEEFIAQETQLLELDHQLDNIALRHAHLQGNKMRPS